MKLTRYVSFSVAIAVAGWGCATGGTDAELCAQAGCDPAASCAVQDGFATCACADGYTDDRGDGTVCTDIDECALGVHGCGDLAECENTAGSFTCNCPAGFDGDGTTCADIDECADGTAECGVGTACRNVQGSYECACAAGYVDEFGDGRSCLSRATGRAVLIGHDFTAIGDAAAELLGNAVFAANASETVEILGYVQYADLSPGGEVINTNLAIENHAAAIGRSVAITTFNNSSLLASLLPGKHVLLIYDQDQTQALTLALVGQSWQTPLDSFIRGGGVVITLDASETWRIVDGAGVIDVTSAQLVSTGSPLGQTEPANLITLGVPATYTAPANTLRYGINGALKLVEDVSNAFVVAQTGNFSGCITVEDFESGVWPTGTWIAPDFLGGTASELAAHDFGFGVINPDFFYETDVLVGRPGTKVKAWVRLTGNGRAHLGVAATTQSAVSFVLAADTDRVIMQVNQFYLFEDQASAAYDVELDQWYLVEVEFTTPSRLTGRVYREDPSNPGQPLVNPDRILAHDFGSLPVGGIAIRGSGGAQIDTVMACAP